MGAGSERTVERDIVLVTIASGASLSGVADLRGWKVVGISVPAEFDGTAMTFQASPDNSTFYNVYSTGGTELSYTTAASRYMPVTTDFDGVDYLKVRAGSSGTPTNQTTTNTVITLHVKRGD